MSSIPESLGCAPHVLLAPAARSVSARAFGTLRPPDWLAPADPASPAGELASARMPAFVSFTAPDVTALEGLAEELAWGPSGVEPEACAA